ncbi:serine hydrolase [Oscillatoria sp. CS-180]|uniref:serine hydrolase n=1 Tax=Oscillatoria sp. CS-180 TaxID=3021720 RepID=UPI00232C274A|nr:serine hydrolase [Oscillatoria sp. CS-180]MDB9524560.1 serine hydrolase [Oscillatoria sp. CS-180]
MTFPLIKLTLLGLCTGLLAVQLALPLNITEMTLGFLSVRAIASTPVSQAAMITPQQALERIFTASEIQANWFAPSFLQQISVAQLEGVLSQVTQGLGDYQGVVETEAGFDVKFERGTVPAQLQLDGNNQIISLFFQPAALPLSLEQATSAIQNVPYPASLLVLKNNTEQATVNADVPLAIGSAFKLAVLAALQNRIQAGELSWDTVVGLQPAWKSLPSGMLQDWPAGTALTLDTLATLMIAISDNTATDALIDIVGRETLEALTPRNQPFLTTRDFFALKNPANADWLERYRQGNLSEKRQVLEATPTLPLPQESLFAGNPVSLDVEWFFTGQELCQLMEQVAPLSAMRVNPGVANPANWQSVAFKGGSEPGVLNLTTWLKDSADNTYCIVTTWNNADQALDELSLSQFHQGILSGLKDSEEIVRL